MDTSINTTAVVARVRNQCRIALTVPGYLTPAALPIATEMASARGKNAMRLALVIDTMARAGEWHVKGHPSAV